MAVSVSPVERSGSSESPFFCPRSSTLSDEAARQKLGERENQLPRRLKHPRRCERVSSRVQSCEETGGTRRLPERGTFMGEDPRPLEAVVNEVVAETHLRPEELRPEERAYLQEHALKKPLRVLDIWALGVGAVIT